MSGESYQGWRVIYVSGTDYEAEMVRDRLKGVAIPAVILNQRDHAFSLTHGYLAKVRVLVPDACFETATNLLETSPVTEEELTRVALGLTE